LRAHVADAENEFRKTVLSKLEGLEGDLQQLRRNQKHTEKQLQLFSAYNPWATCASTAASKKNALKKALRSTYGVPEVCLISGVEEAKDKGIEVTAAHLWPSCRPDEFKEWEENTGEIICKSIDDTANGMLMLRDIERAYDYQRIVFICDPFRVSFKLLVLDPSLKNVYPTGCSRTFEQLEQCVVGKPKINDEKRPSFKILSYHASLSVCAAISKGWLTPEACRGLLETIQVVSPLKLSPKKESQQTSQSS
jgi:hypothetical protein